MPVLVLLLASLLGAVPQGIAPPALHPLGVSSPTSVTALWDANVDGGLTTGYLLYYGLTSGTETRRMATPISVRGHRLRGAKPQALASPAARQTRNHFMSLPLWGGEPSRATAADDPAQ